jgi:hypothetical protein
VPAVFEAMPEPVMQNGREWRLGHLAVIEAAALNRVEDEPVFCPSSAHVTARTATKDTCFKTGKANGTIYWQRAVASRGVVFSLSIQYVEALKAAMDPIVARVNASWRF